MAINSGEILSAIRSDDDTQALQQLYTQLLPKVQRFVVKNSGSKDEAFDCFQDAVMVFYRYVKEGKYDEKQEIGGFIFSVARNLWYNKSKRDSRMTSIPEHFDEDAKIDVMADLISSEREEMISRLFTELGERCKDLLTYTFFNDYSLAKIVELMGFATANAVKTKRYKCKQRLIEIINNNEQYKSMLQEK